MNAPSTLFDAAPPAVQLRPYQSDGVEAIRSKIREGVRRVLVVLATGGGKTLLAAAIIVGAVRKGKRVLFIAHRRELIEQCYEKLLAAGLSHEHLGVILSGDRRRRPQAPVQIASVQTLVGRPMPPADLVFIDEAHHSNAVSYSKVLARYPNATVVGLTATACRADGKGLGDVFTDLVQVATFAQLAAEGFLVAPRVFTSRSPLDLSAVKTTGGDYNLGELASAMNRRELVGDLVEHWLRIAEGRSTLVFASSIEHSRAIVEQFREAGIAAEHLDGTTPADERTAILARLASGETSIVSNMGVLTEGFDCPRVKCVVLARPTKSLSLFLQMAGRGLRPWNSMSAILLDHAGCVLEHGFPQDDRVWSLEGKKKRASTAPPVKSCPTCYAALPGGTLTCTECGHVFDVPGRDGVTQRAGELIEVVPPAETPIAERRDWYRAVLEEAARGSRKLGWARHCYREKFGVWPDGFRRIEREVFATVDLRPTAHLDRIEGFTPEQTAPSEPAQSAAPAEPSALHTPGVVGVERAPRRGRRIDLDALLSPPTPAPSEVETWSL